MPIEYSNNGTRNLKLASDLEAILKSVADKHGYKIKVTSGGQDPKKKTVGSNRHNHGHAADIEIYDSKGKQLIPTNKEHQAILAPFITELVKAGITSVGAGEGYMGGTRFHVDNAIKHGQGVKGVRYWGAAGKSANAPAWLKQAVDSGYGEQTESTQSLNYLSTEEIKPLDLGSGYIFDPENYQASTAPNKVNPIDLGIDYNQWNQYGWIDGKPIIEKQAETKKKKKTTETEDEVFKQALSKVKNPSLKKALELAYQESSGETLNEPSVTQDAEPVRLYEDNTQASRVQRRQTKNLIGSSWADIFGKAEDASKVFNHKNGAYGSFGYRKTGHLSSAYNSEHFKDIRGKYKNYEDFWNEFSSNKGYNDFTNQVDQRYENWLKEQTQGDLERAAEFNYDGNRGIGKPDSYIPPNNKTSFGEYKKRLGLRKYGGNIGKIGWLDLNP